MTSEEWIALITDDKDRKYARAAVIEALESERKGEVVLGEGELEVGLNACLAFTGYKDLMRKQGQLIFRPTKTDKEDKKGGK